MKLKNSLILLLIAFSSQAQTGGDNTYEFLNLSTHSLVTSLGGMNVSLVTDDPGLAYYNPALLNIESSGNISLNYVNYLAGINYGYAAYSRHIEDYGTFSGGITYLNYGSFDMSDPSGSITGKFRASEYALNLIWSYKIDSMFSAGVNFKPVISHLDRYTSVGVLFDLGALYQSRDGLVTAGATIKNLGFQITSYTGVRESMPFEIVAGASARLAYAPFRFSLTARHLEKYNMIHESEKSSDTEPERYTGIGGFSENVMRHLIISAQFIPSENFFISAGFNYQQRKEMIIENRASTVGFSMGAGIKISAFEFTFSRSKYHLAGSSTNISLLIRPSMLGSTN